MKIYAPVKDFNGLRNGVRFVNGVGETDNPQLSEWFRSRGYKVAEMVTLDPLETLETLVDEAEYVEINKLADEEPTFEDMTPNELRDWMKANGFGSKIKNIRNKEKLLEILRG